MAKNYTNIYTAVYTDGNKMNFGNSMIRGNGVPLDITEVYDSYNKAVLYALENPIAYEGQILAVTENGDTTVYVITPKAQGTITIPAEGESEAKEATVFLKKVGTAPVGDGYTIYVDEDGKISLAGVSDLTWKDGEGESQTDVTKYQPVLKKDDEGNAYIDWEVPSATTVEGLDSRLKTAEQNITDAQGDIDALELTVGNTESGLVKKVADAETAISKNAEDIATESSVRETADNEILAQIGVASKPESAEGADDAVAATGLYKAIEEAEARAKQYADDNDSDTIYDDTEVKEDIATNAANISQNAEAIAKNTQDIAQEVTDRGTAITNLETTLKEYVGQEIGKQAHFSSRVVIDKAEMTDSTVLYLFKPEGAEGEDVYEQYIVIDGVATLIGETSVDLTDYSTTTQVEGLISAAISDSETKTNKAIGDVDTRVGNVASDLSDFETEVAEGYATKQSVQNVADDLTELSDKVDGKAESSAVNELSGTVTDLGTTVAGHGTKLTELEGVDTDHEDRIAALEEVGAEKNKIDSVSAEFTISESRELAIASVAQDKVTGLTAKLTAIDESLASKVAKVTSEYNGEQQEWILLSPENQAKLAALTVGDTGNVEISGKVNAENVVGLDSYITTKRDSVAGLLSTVNQTKLEGIAAGAQVNVIEGFSIAGAAITPVNKVVDLPIATQTKLGVVLSSAAENKVSVATDGTMEVNSINVNKLAQTEGDVLILDGGTSL